MSDPNASAKRNALILSAAQALSGSAAPIAIALGALVGNSMLGVDKSLATAPVTGYNIGVALAALPAAMLMARVGRRIGFMSGAFVGALGALVCVYAILIASFWLFAIGMAVSGIGSSFTQQYRFAAADQGTDDFKPKAISWVLAGGVFAAIIGPQVAINFGDAWEGVPFAGAFIGGACLMLAGVVALSFLRFDKPMSAADRKAAGSGRPLGVIVRQPRFLVSVFCAVCAYALMSFVMTGAPLAMMICGFSPDQSTFGISLHVIAMFGPSFFTGNLIARFGKERIVATGMVMLSACAVVALLGIDLSNFYIALILLGVGWNFGFIGATAMLTECYRPEEKAKAQGANDVILFSMVAFASLMSGHTLNTLGWDWLNIIVFPVTLACLAALVWLHMTKRPTLSTA